MVAYYSRMADAKYLIEVVLEGKGFEKLYRGMDPAMKKGRKGFGGLRNSIMSMSRIAGSQFNRMANVGSAMVRQSVGLAANWGKVGLAIGVAAGAMGMVKLVSGAIKFNVEMERAKNNAAAAMMLFGMFKAPGRSKADEMKMAFGAAEAQAQKEFEIAALSPASYAETRQMSSNLFSGFATISKDMDRFNRLLSNSLTLGMLSENKDFSMTGSQIGRMMTGGAGAEQETWRAKLAPVVSELGASKGYWQKGLFGGDLTKAFNQLTNVQRLELLEGAMENLHDITLALAQSWDGLTGTVASVGQMLLMGLGKNLFEGMKKRMMAWVQPGGGVQGIFDPAQGKGVHYKRLKQAADFAGHLLGKAGDKVMNKVQQLLIDVTANWEGIAIKLERAFLIGKQAAQWLLKAAIFRTGMGAGLAVGGAAGAGAMSAVQMGVSIASLGAAALVAAPLLAGLAAVAGSLGIVFAGVVAWFSEHWDTLITAFRNGQIVLWPLLLQLDIFWAKLLNVGAAFLGANAPIDAANQLISTLTGVMMWLIESIGDMLEFGGQMLRLFDWIAIGFNLITAGINTFGLAIVWLAKLLMKATTVIPGFGEQGNATVEELQHLENAFVGMLGEDHDDMAKIWKRLDGQNWAEQAAEAWRNGKLTAGEQGPGSRMGDLIKSFLAPTEAAKNAAAMADQKNGGKGGAKIKIDKVVINQDLRNHDPDRIVGAFYSEFTKKVMQRTQSLALPDGGS